MRSSGTRRAFWNDVRFLIGAALVIVSITGVWFVVNAARDTTPVLQSTRTIIEGEPLSAADFRSIEVSLGVAGDEYLSPAELQGDQVAARTITQNELVPRDAIATADSVNTTTLMIDSAVGLSDSIRAGSVVELWVAPVLPEQKGHDTPRILVTDAIVSAVKAPEGMLAQGAATLEVVIDRAEVGAVLTAITNGSVLSAVPVGARP